MDALLAVAHGTRNPAGTHTVSQLLDRVRILAPDLDVRAAYLELVEPAVPVALAAIPPGCKIVVVPLLLSSGYHDRVDLPRAVAAYRPDAVRAAVLGPDPLLAVALADRLAEAGWRAGDAVVLAGAGSADPDAVASVRSQATLLATELTRRGGPDPDAKDAGAAADVTVGFGSAAEPAVAVAVAAARAAGAERVAIAPYLLAPGHFATALGAAGADLVAAPLGAHPAVARLVLERAAAATRG